MPESVADKTPMPITIERRHIDPPGLWVAIVIGSVVLHSLLLWLMFTSKLNIVGRRSNAATPIKVVEVVPTIKAKAKPRVIAQKPKVQPKLQSKPIQVKPKIKTQPVPAQSPQSRTSQPGTITFTNKIPVNKSPLAQKQRSLPPIKPKLEPKVAIIPPKPVKTEPKKPNIAEQQRLQRLEEQRRQDQLVQQQRTQELAQQQRLEKLAQQRAREIAEQRRQDQLVQQQRTQELAQQQRLEKLAQQRAREIAEQRRQDQLVQQQRTETTNAQQQKVQVGGINQEQVSLGKPTPLPAYTPTLTPTPKPVSTPADNTEGQAGFDIATLPISNEEQEALKNTGGTILEAIPQYQPTAKTPKKLLLNEQDKKLVTEPIKCGVWLSIDANGNPFSPKPGFPGIKADTNSKIPGAEDLCQRYADYYFNTMKFIPAKTKDGRPAPGQIRVDITIEPATAS
ncbi:hypothetical protein NIES2101_38035 [Calothrix sp. HK-06]|nr:hypothetical protein NIES2101_38035 [Calothrix sp. HK-06]